MGRNKTGIYEVMECKKINLSYLIKKRLLVKGQVTESKMTWSARGETTGQIEIECGYLPDDKYLRLRYTITDRYDRKEKDYDYRIELVGLPSNLGKGEVLYMMCPSGYDVMCRILYMAYDAKKWYSRKFYEIRGAPLYYPSQARCKEDYMFHRRHKYEDQLNKIWGKKNFHHIHKGKKTKALIKLERLEANYEYWSRVSDRRFEERVGRLW